MKGFIFLVVIASFLMSPAQSFAEKRISVGWILGSRMGQIHVGSGTSRTLQTTTARRWLSRKSAKGTQWEPYVPEKKSLNEIYPDWVITIPAKRIKVGIVEYEGIDYNHPAIAFHIPGESIYDSIDEIPYDFSPNKVKFQHGTSVASVAAHRAPNIEIVPIYADENLWRTITKAYQKGTRIFNFSIGFYTHHNLESDQDVINFKQGLSLFPDALFVFAAGNEWKNIDLDQSPLWPASLSARFPNVITVTALEGHENQNPPGLAFFSNYGKSSVQLAAPGTQMIVALRGGEYGIASGTSYAAPWVANLAARILDINDQLHISEVIEILKRSATQVEGLEGKVAWGMVNNKLALQMARDTLNREPKEAELN